MTINHEDLIAEARREAPFTAWAQDAALIDRLADALESTTARLREAEACIEKARKHLELSLGASAPMSTTHHILTAYKPTTESGSKS